ncbi:pilus assembly protein TadG [Arthrobacter sp. UKPF54-2]|uniref:Tad domain-containing protein n=1 Tax=Arthrobacter sp. UKPF54-2 TaxID=2600159 RepID=UPI0011B1A171|nr:Tad domain-containing protein [Arthrobacter sp. UKPF54-2]QDY90411.1 pilus assembly protein TadG [Arthrobacter sp. UKPF54-2]
MVAILMVALLGFSALAVDVGMLYAERTQLRNSSDAAALAVAQKCAKDINDVECSPTSPLARVLANGNAADGASNVQSLLLDKANRTVTVAAAAQEPGKDPNRVSLFFARALGFDTAEVTAASAVQWGRPVAGQAPFPLAFSICQVKGQVNGPMQLLQNHGKGTNPDCMYGPSGAAVPGGFGWLMQDNGACGATIDLARGVAASDPGNNPPGNCSGLLQRWADDITAGRPVTVFLPIFNTTTGSGRNARYGLIAFAAFSVSGWKFSGNGSLPYSFRNARPHVPSALECTGSCRGIIGTFITFVSLADGYSLGSTDNYGAAIVRLTQ